jgi:uncharacterized protein
MARRLTADDLEPALVGGLFLSAGGSGKRSAARALALGRMALDYGGIRLVTLDELERDDPIITATAIGAPGVADPAVTPRDSVDAARRLAAMLGRPPRGVICGHVPGFNAWLVAAALGLDYVDAASNGRGHPTVKMGGMGLASRPDMSIIQVACSGGESGYARLSFVAEGDIVRTSNVMRQAAVVNGGLIYAARGPLAAGFIKENGAPGAISFQLELGCAMLRANGPDRVQATVDFLGGTLLLRGEVTENTVAYSGGFDLGQMTVRGARGVSSGDTNGEAVLGIYNEYMTADVDGRRVATFPDLIGTLDPQTGEPVAISELPRGSEVAVIVAHRSRFPVGKGALDPVVFPEVEQAMGVDLRSYL